MRIAHVINGLNVGGAETVLLRLISGMDRKAFEPEVISLTDAGTLGRQVQDLDVPLHCLNMSRSVPNPIDFFKLALVLREWKPKVVQTWMMHSDLLGGLSSFLAGGFPVVWGVHHTTFDPAFTKWSSRVTLKCCSKLSKTIPSRIVCCSEASLGIHAALGYPRSRMIVIPNGFDLSVLRRDGASGRAVRVELGLAEDVPIIGVVARYHPQKDHGTFFRAAALLLKRMPSVHFVLCGNGVTLEEPALRAFVSSSGSPNSFHLLGTRDDMPGVNSAFTLATLTSAWGEAFPLAIGEAMCCEVPCVATSIGDLALMIGPTGKVVPPANPEALSGAWFDILSKSPLERRDFGRAARDRVGQLFSLAAMVSRYESLYTECAAKSREGRPRAWVAIPKDVTRSHSGVTQIGNVDLQTVDGFGLQWKHFNQVQVPLPELQAIFDKYFETFPWNRIDRNSVGLDAGCGSGRWTTFVAPRVAKLICVDASPGAAAVAEEKLRPFNNCEVHVCTLEDSPVADNSLDFAYCLGVLHYVPDPQSALTAIARKLKPGAPLLLYVYYALDNRPFWFRALWRVVDFARRNIARTPYRFRQLLSEIIATLIYFPLARTSRMLERFGFDVSDIPLSAYRGRSFYTMRTDCLDRFGNHLEHRFTRQQLVSLLDKSGFINVTIPRDEPYWRAVAIRA